MTANAVRIYHNPRCSKSRETLSLLRERGIEPEIIEYLKQPPSERELERLIALLGGDPQVLVRKKEAAYRAHGLSERSTPIQIVAAIAREPVLMERPVVVVGDRAVIGRPPEAVLALL